LAHDTAPVDFRLEVHVLLTLLVNPMIPTNLQAALDEWRICLGSENVITDRFSRAAVETTTFSIDHAVPAILRPADRSQVQECLRIASRYRVAVYPVSSGKNWGYGSGVPSRSDTVILNLGRMDRIVDFDEKLAYVTVEPGVTQQQLQDFLIEKKSKLWMDSSGATPLSSLIGNTMERGFGHTPYGDHFSYSCGLEVVLPAGACIQTGFCRFPNSRIGPLHRFGLGAVLDGLFSQSNFGVVTRMTIWLMPAPAFFQAFFIRCSDHCKLGPIVDALGQLRLSGVLQSEVHIGNDYKVINGLQQYPWKETNGETPLSLEQMAQFRHKLQIGVWNAAGALYGTRSQVAESRRLIRAALKGKADRVVFVSDRLLAISLRFAGLLKYFTGWDFTNTLSMLKTLFGLLKGIPTEGAMASAYWRKRTPVPKDMDPDRDGCGLLWLAPVIPATAEDVTRIQVVTIETMLDGGFEPMISLTLINGRAIHCVISFSYDRQLPGEDQRAIDCYHLLATRVNALGYYSYRLGIQSMEEMTRNSDESYLALLRTLKAAVDPAGILSPGRYEAPALPVAPFVESIAPTRVS
jgi:4-cresol dehydrogenase (hydroxylating) flavoprotein subunit